MIKNFNKKRIFSALLVVATLCTGAISPATYAKESAKLVISPVSAELELKPGDTYEGIFKVINSGDEGEFDYKAYVDPYYISDEDYTPNFGIKNDHTQIVDWITLDKNHGHLEPGTHDEIHYTIKVPNNAPGGGQYATLIAEVENEGNGMVQTTARVGEILIATVDGETNECVKITSNDINTFMFEPPIKATSFIENCGNIHATAEYIMKVTPLFSNDAIYSNEENPEKQITLPETRRFNTQSWTKEDGAPMMGIYNVEQTVKIGKETSTVKKLVFIFPLWLIIIFILLIAAIVFKLVSNSRRRKESKRSSVNTPEKSTNSDSSSD